MSGQMVIGKQIDKKISRSYSQLPPPKTLQHSNRKLHDEFSSLKIREIKEGKIQTYLEIDNIGIITILSNAEHGKIHDFLLSGCENSDSNLGVVYPKDGNITLCPEYVAMKIKKPDMVYRSYSNTSNMNIKKQNVDVRHKGHSEK